MISRNAVDTIRGYFYQFDLTILQILKLPSPLDTVDVENIEDVDINTATESTAIQCKYYSKTEYNHSVIGNSVRLMLRDFIYRKKSGLRKINYLLYGAFKSGQSKLTLPLTIENLKSDFLIYSEGGVEHRTHEILGADDNALALFLSSFSVNIQAPTSEVQHLEVIKELENAFGCTHFESENYYYNNALNLIRVLSTDDLPDRRRISKDKFLRLINTRDILFNTWFIELKGKAAYLLSIKRQHFSLGLNPSPFERFFLIETSIRDYNRQDAKSLLLQIQNKWSNLSKREPQSFCPYIYFHNIDDQELLAIKKALHQEQIRCIDGHDYHGADFSATSIIRQATFHNGIKIKILNRLEHLAATLNEIRTTIEVFQFYLDDPFFIPPAGSSFRHVKLEKMSLKDVQEVMK